ncbi:alpha/beta hydrolase [Rhodobacter lacus]|uniref:Alpha/beta hydrolase n=1 Tax=Rhodobacter lacus TaxID=1641972 RepID=A0ABW5ABS1_9RHOB
MRLMLATAIGVALLGTPGTAADPQDLGPAVVLEHSARFAVDGPNGPLVVQAHWPAAAPPPEGYGIIYALDAGWTFGTLCDALALQGSAQAAGPVRPTVVVGIGWPGPGLIDMDRRGPDLVEAPGAEAMVRVLSDTILPRIEAALPVDPAHRMVLGHSYGGAFALRAGFARPDLFSHVAAGSPSLWTDPTGLGAPPPGATRPEVLISIGALERPEAARAAGAAPARVERLRSRDMAGRAETLARELGTELVEFPGLSHGASVTPFLAAAVDFLWR